LCIILALHGDYFEISLPGKVTPELAALLGIWTRERLDVQLAFFAAEGYQLKNRRIPFEETTNRELLLWPIRLCHMTREERNTFFTYITMGRPEIFTPDQLREINCAKQIILDPKATQPSKVLASTKILRELTGSSEFASSQIFATFKEHGQSTKTLSTAITQMLDAKTKKLIQTTDSDSEQRTFVLTKDGEKELDQLLNQQD
jgi:hypothetical protein